MSKIGNQLTELIRQKKQLATNLNVKGVSANENEKLNTLVPKVLNIINNSSDFKLGTKEITEDGEYYAYTDELDGYSSVNVNTCQDFNFITKIINENGVYYKIKTLSDIPDNGFYYFSKIKEIDLSKSKKIGSYALYNQTSLTNIVAKNPLVVDSNAFYYCQSAEGEITISDEQLEIKDYTFNNCKKIKVNLHDKITNIGRYSFYNCEAIDWNKLPKELKEIGIDAFYKCINLKITEIPENVENILTEAFYYCQSIETLKINNKCKAINARAFQYCGLKELEIGNGITNIGSYAFAACPLEKLTIHATTPPQIQSTTFSNTELTEIRVPLSQIETYKSATTWSNYADIMIGIEGE